MLIIGSLFNYKQMLVICSWVLFCIKHPNDVADAFRQWAHCITYYHDYYEDSYLMPLVVSSLKGDASDVFNWT